MDGFQFWIIFLFVIVSRLVLGPTQSPLQWVLGTFLRVKTTRAWSWPLTSI